LHKRSFIYTLEQEADYWNTDWNKLKIWGVVGGGGGGEGFLAREKKMHRIQTYYRL